MGGKKDREVVEGGVEEEDGEGEGGEGGEGGLGGRPLGTEDTMRKPSRANRYDAPLHIVVPATIHLLGQSHQ